MLGYYSLREALLLFWIVLLLPKLGLSQDFSKIGRYGEKTTVSEEEEDNILSRRFYIGAVLPDTNAESFFQKTINYLNFDGVSVSPTCTLYHVSFVSSGSPIQDARLVCNKLIAEGPEALRMPFDGVSVSPTCTLYHVSFVSSGSPIQDARLVCNKLIAEGVFAMIIGGGNMSTSATSAVSYTGGFYDIPVIGTSSRESAFSDKNIHVSFLRTVPPYNHQADVWVEILQLFKYKRVVFIHSSDSDGRALLGKLRSLAETTQDDKAVKVTSVIEFEPGMKDLKSLLRPLAESLIRVFLLFANKYDADIILREAADMKLTGNDSVWILNEDALKAKTAPLGAMGLHLKHASNQNGHIRDALRLVTQALKELHDESPELIIRPPNTCEMEDPWNITGKLLFSAIQEQILYNGETGKVAFDSKGDRKYAEYSIVNLQSSSPGAKTSNKLVSVGDYFYDKEKDRMTLKMKKSKIIWGGGPSKPPLGISVPRQLKVITIEETPFLYSENMSENEGGCIDYDESVCIWENPDTKEMEKKCCYGYCVELLKKLSTMNNFSFTLHLCGSDMEYGENYVGEKGQSVWTGMIGQLINKSTGADMIVAPLTINPERAQVIDYTKPFKYQGITILVKKAKRSTALVSILQPFQFNLWMMLLATVHAIALLVWLLDRFSPMFKNEGTESDSLKISEAFWFSWGVILNSGLGEGTPRCLSSRVMSMIWAGFAMIIVASYTANLAAFLVLEDRGQTITGINDAKLRNPVDNFRFATVKGSAVDMFFRRKTEWANMYRVMEANNYHSAEEAMKALKSGTLKAFIWDSSRLEYEASKDCELVTAGELFGRSGYGIGIRKDMFWSEKITLDVLELHESGFMADLDDKWIWVDGPECPPDKLNSPQRLGLANLEGIFVMVVGGVVAGTVLVVIELMYKKYKGHYAEKKAEHRTELECPAKGSEKDVPRDAFGNFLGEREGHQGEALLPSEICEFCEENKRNGNTSLCTFCSNILPPYPPVDSDPLNYPPSIWENLESRLEASANVPSKMKSITPSKLLRFQAENKRKLKDEMKGQSKDSICLHYLSDEALRNMIDFVEQNNIENFPSCECQENECYPSKTSEIDNIAVDEQVESNSETTESIISGEFSCPQLHAISDRKSHVIFPTSSTFPASDSRNQIGFENLYL